mmetsp:Transcript_43490/g.114735  ORF Transcript_43490/g.114735 Transcript_43490/m.114735 type:complete len:426 (-) Transcript_43490:171-1448(-)
MTAKDRSGWNSGWSDGSAPEDVPVRAKDDWLKEPEETELNYDSEDDSHEASRLKGERSAHQGRAAKLTGTLVGRSTEGTELQHLDIEQGGSVRQVRDRPKKPLYKVWPSRNKFFCRGFLMTGGETELGITPNWSVPNLCVWTCILAPCSLYFIWVFPYLWRQGVYAMPAATLAVFLMATGFLLATCCSDPGIIPRREVVLATNSSERLGEVLGYDLLASDSVPLDGKNGGRNLPIELTSRGYRWCRTCRIIRPPRASHCPDCDNCVLRYDHHCPFVNNCVGQRNYHFFFGFVTSVLCLAMLVLPVLFWFLNSDDFEGGVEALTNVNSGVLRPLFWSLIACGALIGVATFMSLVLWMYHVFLIATRRTTKEFRKSLDNIADEPTLCASRGPRLFDPWVFVDPRDLTRQDETPAPQPDNFCSVCFGD